MELNAGCRERQAENAGVLAVVKSRETDARRENGKVAR